MFERFNPTDFDSNNSKREWEQQSKMKEKPHFPRYNK